MTTLDQHPSGLDVTVTSWDVDANQRLTTTALGRYMQESAEVNAASMGAGLEDLAREGQTWVLYGLLIRIARYPRFRDRISIETWPRELVGRRAMRDFRIRDAAGDIIATATSSWYCLDLATRRPASADRWHNGQWRADEHAHDRDPDRLAPLEAPDKPVPVPVRWSDLDLIGHVTNTRYQDLVLESYPEHWLRNHAVAEFELNFLAEGRYPDTLLSRRQADPGTPDTWRHELARESDGKVICRARVVWR